MADPSGGFYAAGQLPPDIEHPSSAGARRAAADPWDDGLRQYELSGSVSEQDLNGKKEFSGPLTVRHVGLCTRDGPKETVGEIRFELTQSSPRITATLDFDGSKCSYKGIFSESYHGFMDCGREGSIPLRLWIK